MTGPAGLGVCRCSGRDGFKKVGEDDWVCATCGKPQPKYEEKASGGLAFFRGGPLDGRAYAVSDLLKNVSLELPLLEYSWTPEKVTSEATGRTARVWMWKGAGIVAAEAAEVEQQQQQSQRQETEMQNTTADGVTSEQLLDRRKALGLSRTIVSDKAGITTSQLGSLEMSGKRIKPGVMDAVHDALTFFEKQKGTSSEATDAKEDHSASSTAATE